MRTSWYLNKKSTEICIKARPPPASPASLGQVTKYTTVYFLNFHRIATPEVYCLPRVGISPHYVMFKSEMKKNEEQYFD